MLTFAGASTTRTNTSWIDQVTFPVAENQELLQTLLINKPSRPLNLSPTNWRSSATSRACHTINYLTAEAAQSASQEPSHAQRWKVAWTFCAWYWRLEPENEKKKKYWKCTKERYESRDSIVVYERCVTWTNHANLVMLLYGWNLMIIASFIEERKQQYNQTFDNIIYVFANLAFDKKKMVDHVQCNYIC